jgi:hypothetical protein
MCLEKEHHACPLSEHKLSHLFLRLDSAYVFSLGTLITPKKSLTNFSKKSPTTWPHQVSHSFIHSLIYWQPMLVTVGSSTLQSFKNNTARWHSLFPLEASLFFLFYTHTAFSVCQVTNIHGNEYRHRSWTQCIHKSISL